MGSFRVPQLFQPVFEKAETYVRALFSDVVRRPEEGTIHIGGQRYVFVRCESLYLSWFESMAASFGEEPAREFIYNTAREIGRSDSREFAERLKVPKGVEALAAGPIHFAHAGWAFVDILADSAPATDPSYFLHYYHPNTFESEVLRARGRKVEQCACHFSAGYSAGWCSEAFGLEVHGREIRCTARGEENCEFVMAPADKLSGHERRLLGK
jgi:predicted hydrocarbon binding protein